jgi:hypothetical protein
MISDNEDATAALGHSEILSVKNSVGEPIPEFPQRPEDDSKSPSSVMRQDTGDVFPDQPPGLLDFSKSEEFEGQVATRIIQSKSLPGLGEGLAGGAPDEEVDWSVSEGWVVM